MGSEDPGLAWLHSISPGTFLGPDGLLRYFVSATGQRIASYYWPARGKAKAVIQLVHGHGSYLCYEYLKIEASMPMMAPAQPAGRPPPA